MRISLIFLALLPVIPLFATQHANPLPSFHVEWLAMMSGLLACLAVLPVLPRIKRLRIPRTVLLPLTLMAFIALQLQLLPQVNKQHAQMAVLYLLWATLLMVLVGLLSEQTSRERVGVWLASGLTAAAVCGALSELVVRLMGVYGWWGGLAQANNYGDLLALGLVSALYLFSVIKPASRIYLPILVVAIVLGLSLTPSRSVWLYWVAVLLMAWRWRCPLLKVLIPALGLYLLLQGLWATGILPTQQTAVERLYQEVGGAPLRLHIWMVAWQTFLQAPWSGQGFGQFDWVYFNAGQHLPELEQRMEHAHNLILHLLAELGIFPVLLLLSLVGLWLRQMFMAMESSRDEKQSDNVQAFRLWLLMLVAILAIHSLLEYPLWYAEFLGVAAIVLALGDEKCWSIRFGKAGIGSVSGLLVMGIAVAGVHEWHYAKMERALNELSRDASAAKFNHLLGACRQASIRAPLLAPYVAVVFSFATNPADEKLRSELTLLTDASFRFFPSKNLVYQQALLQALNDMTDDAEATMKSALAAYPGGAAGFIKEADALTGDDRKKVEALIKLAAFEAGRFSAKADRIKP